MTSKDRWRALRYWVKANLGDNRFLKKATGVVHVGGHLAQERITYYVRGLPVLWFEADPGKAETIRDTLKTFAKQHVIQALLSDTDSVSVPFHISSNDGASSSMFELADHKKIWPTVDMVGAIALKSHRFDTLARDQKIDLSHYDTLVMDVQGAELKVLKGFGDALRPFKRLQLEAADFNAYEGGTTVDELIGFCRAAGFLEAKRTTSITVDDVGSYYELYFERP